MTADEQRREDRKRELQFLLALLGGGWLFGSAVVGLFVRTGQALAYWTAGEVEAE